MKDFVFSGLGTGWYISTDGEVLSDDVKKAILEYVEVFENKFSRFLFTSESNAFRKAEAGDYIISEELSELLSIADRLRVLTNGLYDPGVGMLLEGAGYGGKHKIIPLDNVNKFVLPKWSLLGRTLALDGPVSFDFGGIGKGYCIDKVAQILERFGYRNFLVDGGGDIFATTKKDGNPWRIAIEYPGNPEVVLGTIDLKNQGIAVSDIFRRRWGKWHHLFNPQKKEVIKSIVSGVAVSDSALNADCMTSALFFSGNNNYHLAAQAYKAKYLFLKEDGITEVSLHWDGELF